MQAKRVRYVCCLKHLKHLHSFLAALPRPHLGLILSCLASPRSRQCCLGLGLGLFCDYVSVCIDVIVTDSLPAI